MKAPVNPLYVPGCPMDTVTGDGADGQYHLFRTLQETLDSVVEE